MKSGIIFALLSAVLFGASTPFAKLLIGQSSPMMFAGLLYGGSGVGLLSWMLLRKHLGMHSGEAGITKQDIPWLAGAILMGGIIAPILLMIGITLIPASSASLLLNLEGVFTALLAWSVFKENFDRRIMFGMVLIILAGIVLSWEEGQVNAGIPWGGIFIAAACFCWGIDNNLTRKISASDPVQIAGIKGMTAAIVNLSIAASMSAAFPPLKTIILTGLVGLAGYGLSLVLFVLALRHLGTARTGAYFSSAPFVGAAISMILLHEVPSISFWIAGGLMGLGIWLHLTEHHEHEHTHEITEHSHEHTHDNHHQHEHDFSWDGTEPHTHPHVHAKLTHSHPHYPDIHHQHSHS